MAVNDLMMKIQLLVDAGKSSAELRRLKDQLKSLTENFKKLQSGNIQYQHPALKGFTESFKDINQEITKTGSQLNKLNGEFNKQSANLNTTRSQYKSALSEFLQFKSQFSGLQGQIPYDLMDEYSRRRDLVNALRKQYSAEAQLKRLYDEQYRSAASALQQRLNLLNIKANPISLNEAIQSLKDARSILKTTDVSNFSQSITSIQSLLSKLGLSSAPLSNLQNAYQKLDQQLKSGALTNYQQDVLRLQGSMRDIRTNEIIPLQNEINRLSKEKGFEKALKMDGMAAQTRVFRAELREASNELGKLYSIKNKTPQDIKDIESLKSKIQSFKDQIVTNDLATAKANKSIVDTYNVQLAQNAKTLQDAQARYSIDQNNLKTARENLAIEKEKERSIRSQIRELTKTSDRDIASKLLPLQTALSESKTKQANLKDQIKDTESLAKAELQRINTVQQESKAVEKAALASQKQGMSISSLGSAFKSYSGPAKEFMEALKFAAGPQMLGFAAGAKLVSFADSFVQINKSVENLIRGLNAINQGQGLTEFNTMVGISNKLGISIDETTHSFLQLKASAMGTGLEGEKINKIFTSFANALNVTGADSISFNRAFRALSQMIAKGQIYSEELKGQLAEQLPGSIQLFARALDLPVNKFMMLVKTGALAGSSMERALVLAANEADRSYKRLGESSFTFSQKAALAKNAFLELNVAIGNTGIWRIMGDSMLYVRDTIKGLSQQIPNTTNQLQALKESWSKTWQGIVSGMNPDELGFGAAINKIFVLLLPAPIRVAYLIVKTFEYLPPAFERIFSQLPPIVQDGLRPIEDAVNNLTLFKALNDLPANLRIAFSMVGAILAEFNVGTQDPYAEQIKSIKAQLGELDKLRAKQNQEHQKPLLGFDAPEAEKTKQAIREINSELQTLAKDVGSFEKTYTQMQALENKLKELQQTYRSQNANRPFFGYDSEEVEKTNQKISSLKGNLLVLVNAQNEFSARGLGKLLDPGIKDLVLNYEKLKLEIIETESELKKTPTDKVSELQEKLSKLKTTKANIEINLNEATLKAGLSATERLNEEFSRLYQQKEQSDQQTQRAVELNRTEQREFQRIAFYSSLLKENKGKEIGSSTKLLSISKEELTVQKNKLDLQQAYQDALLKISESKYQKWAKEGQITQEGADFLAQAAKADVLRKAWSTSTDYIEQYQTAQKKVEHAGDNITAGELEYVKMLRKRADDQLAYAGKKAEEANDENKINQIYRIRQGLKDDELKSQLSINKVLDEAEKEQSNPQQPVTIDAEGIKNNYIELNGKLIEFAKANPVPQPVTIDPATALTENDKLNQTLKLPVTKQVFIEWVNANSTSPPSDTGGVPKRWGGFIGGYGGGDRIRALLEPGEFVLRKEATRALGIDALSRLNQLGARASMGLVDQISIPRFSSGGMVSGNPIVINVPGSKPIHLSGSRDSATQLVQLLTRTGRAL